MDCCNTDEKREENNLEKVKGGKTRMDRKIILWIVIGILFLAVLFLAFKAGVIGSSPIGPATKAAQTAASSYGGMVGGC